MLAHGPEPQASSPEGLSSPEALDSRIIRHLGSFSWEGITAERYKKTTTTWRGITRFELAGKRGEATRFHVRYFEIEPGGYSTLERHRHEHVVMTLRGEGEVRLGCEIHTVRLGDLVYISPDTPHQLRNQVGAPEPFGFLCIVDAARDRPEPLDGVEACGICE